MVDFNGAEHFWAVGPWAKPRQESNKALFGGDAGFCPDNDFANGYRPL